MAGFFEFALMRVRGDIDQKLLSELYHEYLNVEDVDGIPYIDKATVIFEIRNNEHIVEGKLDIPLRLPPSE